MTTTTVSVPQVHPPAYSYCTAKVIPPTTKSITTGMMMFDKSYMLSVQSKFIHMWMRDMPAKYPQHKTPHMPSKACEFAQACYMLLTGYGEHSMPAFNGYSRDFLMMVSNQLGYAYIPAWIVKDKSRRLDRSMYMVPEVSIYAIAYLSTLPTPTTNEVTTNA